MRNQGRKRQRVGDSAIVSQFSLADLFDRAGRLRQLKDLPPEILTEIKSFDVVRLTTRKVGETVITEELIRIQTRDRRTAEVARRGPDSLSGRRLRMHPLAPNTTTAIERSAGSGATTAARVVAGDME
jgi:hypothetical protein